MAGGRPIFVPLNTAPYEKFKARMKRVEIRERDSPVARQVLKDPTVGRLVVLSHGYKRDGRITGFLGEVWSVGQGYLLPDHVLDLACLGDPERGLFDPDGPLVAFEVIIGV